jgi:replicative DNA helicase
MSENNIQQILENTAKQLYNLNAEQALLGGILLNNEYLNRVNEFLLPEHFYEPIHQKIYAYILDTIQKTGIVANEITLKSFFSQNEQIKANGGLQYFNTLFASASGIIDLLDYGRLIFDLSSKRKLVNIGEEIVNQAYKSGYVISAEQQIEQAEAKLFDLSIHGQAKKQDFSSISNSLKETINKAQLAKQRDSHISGISTGLLDLDNILGGLQSSDLIILAGRPSMGKTALGINIAINACKWLNPVLEDKQQQKAVGFFSLEMSSEQLSTRILSMECSINSQKFRNGQLNQTEWEVIATRSGEISNLPFFIDETPALSIVAIRNRVRKMIRKQNLSLLVVDYLQLIKGSFTKADQGRVQEVSEITQGLKAIAKEFNVPVIALSQLSRAVEQREDKRPQLSDLRESGSIEQDADVVAFIYRQSYYVERERPSEDQVAKFEDWKNKMQQIAHKAEIIIAKQRNGPVGSVELFFDAEFTRFGNLQSF